MCTITCNHIVHRAHFEQHLLDEADLGAGLQVAHTLAEDGGEHAPDLSLACDLTVGQQLHHAADALRLLDDEVHFQVKFATNQLQEGEGEEEEDDEGHWLRARAREQGGGEKPMI